MIGGMIAGPGFGFFGLLFDCLRHPAAVEKLDLDWLIIAVPASALGGAVVGLLEATALHFNRILVRLPGTIRIWAEPEQWFKHQRVGHRIG